MYMANDLITGERAYIRREDCTRGYSSDGRALA